MTTIYLMRHGHTENPNGVFYGKDFVLSEQGKRQIVNLAQDMKEKGAQPLFSRYSPFTRAQQTCEIATKILRIQHTRIDQRLEEWDAGPWFNKPLKDFYAATRYDETPPRVEDSCVERLEDMAKRVIGVITEIKEEAKGSCALLVSHREPLVSAMLTLQGLSWETIHDVIFDVATVWELTYAANGELIGIRKAFDHHKDT